MTDRELLELAARARGELPDCWLDSPAYFDGVLMRWNPLENDGDALRLANELELSIRHIAGLVEVRRHQQRLATEHHHITDVDAATRRAIVRAAAAIGRELSP